MTIDWSSLRSLTAREIISALIRDGFSLRSSQGAHQRYRHPDGRRVTVSFHKPGDTFPPKTLKRIIQDQAQWQEEDLIRLKLLYILKFANCDFNFRMAAARRKRRPIGFQIAK